MKCLLALILAVTPLFSYAQEKIKAFDLFGKTKRELAAENVRAVYNFEGGYYRPFMLYNHGACNALRVTFYDNRPAFKDTTYMHLFNAPEGVLKFKGRSSTIEGDLLAYQLSTTDSVIYNVFYIGSEKTGIEIISIKKLP
jgi:hypothetical protein